MTMFKRLLVPVDGTRTSQRALVIALALANDQDARIHVLHVMDDSAIIPMFDPVGYLPDYFDTMIDSLRASGKKILQGAEKLAAKSGRTVQAKLMEARGQGVAKAILRHATLVRADLIVMGTHGRRGMSRIVMGSDAEEVVRDSKVPVLLVRVQEAKPRGKKSGAAVASKSKS